MPDYNHSQGVAAMQRRYRLGKKKISVAKAVRQLLEKWSHEAIYSNYCLKILKELANCGAYGGNSIFLS